MKRLWIFDFDGTLVDSEVAIRKCYLQVTAELIPERLDYVKNILIGPTLEETTKLIITKENLHLKEKFFIKFQKEYDEKIVLETPIFPGVDDVIKLLKKNGDSLSILTNKRSYPTQKLIQYYQWNDLFEWVACTDDYSEAKNKTEILKIKNINQKNYEEIFLVGDTVGDAIAAKNHQIKFIKAVYGYGKQQNWENISIYKSIDSFNELKTFL